MGQCTKCGAKFVSAPETPTPDALCKYCEIEKLKDHNAKLRAALVGFIGVDTREELTEMAQVIPTTDGSKDDKQVALNAVNVLLETL